MKDLTSTNFDEAVASSPVPVLVDFWATWCGPCKTLAPQLEAAAEDLDGVVEVVKVDIDDAPDIARRFDVMSVPTLLLLVEGVPVSRWVGARPARAIVDDVTAALT